MGTVGEIELTATYWKVAVYDKHGKRHTIRIPLGDETRVGYAEARLNSAIHPGVQVELITGPKRTVRRLELTEKHQIIPLKTPVKRTRPKEPDQTP